MANQSPSDGHGAATSGQNGRVASREISNAVVRFAGDSGDGMQLAGTQFTDTAAVLGNDIATLPDYPAEIRAPAGTVAGVSGFQINFADQAVYTPGDKVDALIAMNPAAFKAHIRDVEPGGIVIVDDSQFEKTNLKKAKYPEDYNPLDDETYTHHYQIFRVPITRLNQEALAESRLGTKQINRCKNMYALGVVYWLYNRPLDNTIQHIRDYFEHKKGMPEVAGANINALKAGYYFGETAELFTERFHVNKAAIPPGKYRKVTGNEALTMGLISASQLSGKTLLYCSYPITPASPILHAMAAQRHFGVKTFQAEDEMASVCAAIGAGYAGQLGVCGTSGPGMALKQEAIGLAVMMELPLVVVDVQRGGPSTGLPTKTEQSDLLQALFGRNGDCPVIVLAPQSPSDCFDIGLEAAKLSMQHMVPAVVLSDGYLANGAEPWRIPEAADLASIEIEHATDPEDFEVYGRDQKLTRPWAIPGTPGMEHRVGGLEKEHKTGNVMYDPENHQLMTEVRKQKVEKVAQRVPPIEPYGAPSGEMLILGWGGTYGSIVSAVDQARADGKSVSAAHLRYLNPMPSNLGDLFGRFKRILIPELNTGQLRPLIRAKYLVDARGLNKVQGKPLLVEELLDAIELMLNDQFGDRESLVPRDHEVSPEHQAYSFD
jgi:2-oxoglutarate ferredoxin oxidoreductase subunit alpha